MAEAAVVAAAVAVPGPLQIWDYTGNANQQWSLPLLAGADLLALTGWR